MVLELRVTGQRFYKPDPGVVISGVKKKNHVGSSCGEKHAIAVLVVKALW